MKKWGVLIILAFSMFIIVVDTTIMNVSISALVADLNTTVGGIQAAISIYALVMASLILTGGKLGDVIGKKRTFTVGLLFFGVGTFGAAFSQTLLWLIVFWSLFEGIGSALMLPNIQTILRGEYEGKDRATGYGMIGAVTAVGAALGPIIGGYLTTFHTWRYAFLFEVAIVVGILLFRNLIKKDILPKLKPKLDYVGTILSFVGLASIVLGFLLVSDYGFWFAKQPFVIGGVEIAPFGLSIVPFMVGFGILILLTLFKWESRLETKGAHPLFKPSLFRRQGLTAGLSVDFVRVGVTAGFLFTFPLFLQITYEFTAMQTGIALIPFSISVLIFALGGARFSSKFKAKRIIQTGLIFTIVGALFLSIAIDPENSRKLIPGTIVMGAGIGIMASQVINLVLSTVRSKDTSEAAGLDGTAQQLGNSIAVALVGSVLFAVLTSGVIKGINESQTIPQESKASAVQKVEGGVELLTDTQLEQVMTDAGIDQELSEEVFAINSVSRVTAFQSAVLFLLFATALGLVLSPGLPNIKLVKE